MESRIRRKVYVRFGERRWRNLPQQCGKALPSYSTRENVDLIVHGINDELSRHAEEIKGLHKDLEGKVGAETMWKVAGLVIALGGIISGVISAVINYFARH